MKASVVIDTNVPKVANGQTPQASAECMLVCVRELEETTARRVVLIDDRGLILDEYAGQLKRRGQPGVGDAFFKWLWDRQGDEHFCRRITVTPLLSRGFAEFPNDPALAKFDPSDRKFVATAIASAEDPDLLNAADTDWWAHRRELQKHGVRVRFLCPELMEGTA